MEILAEKLIYTDREGQQSACALYADKADFPADCRALQVALPDGSPAYAVLSRNNSDPYASALRLRWPEEEQDWYVLKELVTEELERYTVFVEQPERGSITVNDQVDTRFTFSEGSQVTVDVLAEEGYQLEWLEMHGEFYPLTVTQPDKGSILVNGEKGRDFSFEDGSEITLTLVPAEGYGQEILLVNGQTYSSPHTFAIKQPATVTGEVSILGHLLTVSQPEHGDITVNGEVGTEFILDHGTDVLLKITPAEGYEPVSFTVNGDRITRPYAFKLTGNAAVAGSTAAKVYPLIVEQPDGGSITVNGEAGTEFALPHDSVITVQLEAQPEYEAASLTINGSPVSNPATFKLGEELAISGVTVVRTYALAVEQPQGGYITVNGDIVEQARVTAIEKAEFALYAEDDYQAESLCLDGESIQAVNWSGRVSKDMAVGGLLSLKDPEICLWEFARQLEGESADRWEEEAKFTVPEGINIVKLALARRVDTPVYMVDSKVSNQESGQEWLYWLNQAQGNAVPLEEKSLYIQVTPGKKYSLGLIFSMTEAMQAAYIACRVCYTQGMQANNPAIVDL